MSHHPVLKAGSFGAYDDFGEEQSVTSLRSYWSTGDRTSNRTNKTFQFGVNSLYSIEAYADKSLGLNKEQEEEISMNLESEGEMIVQIIMPDGDLEHPI